MKMLVVSGYPAWNKVSKGLMPSFHLFGVHELIDHYETIEGSIRGIFKDDVLGGGYVDFYLWNSGKKNIILQVCELKRKSKEYDIIFDQLNRCSIFLGVLKKVGLLKCKLLTVLHHPPYNVQLNVADSDAYIFFNEDFKALAEKAKPSKRNRYYVNEWHPDMKWYNKIMEEVTDKPGDVFFIDTGKSKRDRTVLLEAAKRSQIRVDYAGESNGNEGLARPYAVDLKDDIGMIKRIMKYKAEVIPVWENPKNKIGPLGITSFMDCVALGIPVVASDNVCFAKDIKDNGLGLLYKTGDADSLATAMKRLSEDVDFYNSCREKLHSYANKTVEEYSNILVEVISHIS